MKIRCKEKTANYYPPPPGFEVNLVLPNNSERLIPDGWNRGLWKFETVRGIQLSPSRPTHTVKITWEVTGKLPDSVARRGTSILNSGYLSCYFATNNPTRNNSSLYCDNYGEDNIHPQLEEIRSWYVENRFRDTQPVSLISLLCTLVEYAARSQTSNRR